MSLTLKATLPHEVPCQDALNRMVPGSRAMLSGVSLGATGCSIWRHAHRSQANPATVKTGFLGTIGGTLMRGPSKAHVGSPTTVDVDATPKTTVCQIDTRIPGPPHGSPFCFFMPDPHKERTNKMPETENNHARFTTDES